VGDNDGAFRQLEALLGTMRAVESGRAIKSVLKTMGPAAVSLAHDSFDLSRDPYGRPWPHLRFRQGKPLLDTGRLRASITQRPLTDGFEVWSNVAYARIHNEGGEVRQQSRLQVNAHGRDGGFISHSAARRRKAVHVSVSAIGPRIFGIPERRFIPRPDDLGPVWTAAFEDLCAEWLTLLSRRVVGYPGGTRSMTITL
jgi:phage gpG-like protein